MTHVLFGVGYQSWKDTRMRMPGLVDALRRCDVNLVVDIRLQPSSAERDPESMYGPKEWHLQEPGHGIATALSRSAIRYLLATELGNPQRRDPEMRILRSHLSSGDPTLPVFRGLLLLRDLVLAAGNRCCLLCACESPGGCHRSLIAEALKSRLIPALDIREAAPPRVRRSTAGRPPASPR